MNRLLKIILSLLILQKPKIQPKISEIVNSSMTDNHLRKPALGIQLWGPKYENIDNKQNKTKPKETCPDKTFGKRKRI